MNINIFLMILLGAIMVEATVETIKMIMVDGRFNKSQMISLIVSIPFAVAYNLNILDVIGMSAGVPVVGCIITGILMSRGSGFIHDLIDVIINTFKSFGSEG